MYDLINGLRMHCIVLLCCCHCSVNFSCALAMRLLAITIFVMLQGQGSFQGSKFVLLKTEAEGDTGNMEDGGDYQDNPTMDVSDEDEFGCQDCKIDMKPVYGHVPCTGCNKDPQGSPFSCRTCTFGELQEFKCDGCKRNGGQVVGTRELLHKDSQYEYYRVPVAAGTRIVKGTVIEICEAAGLRAAKTFQSFL